MIFSEIYDISFPIMSEDIFRRHRKSEKALKRAVEIISSAVLLTALFPLILILMIIIWIETGKNPVFTQKRGLTIDKNVFTIYKLRTLHGTNDISRHSHNILLKPEESGRVTKSGRILRRTGLDELLQLINVLRGEMSFIGPRPLSIEDLVIMRMHTHKYYLTRESFTSKPGITGYWQIFGNRSLGTKNLIEMELLYEKDKSFSLDLFLLLMTIPVVAFGRHSDAVIDKSGSHISAPDVKSVRINTKRELNENNYLMKQAGKRRSPAYLIKPLNNN